jgi:hypothetical protein
MSVVLPSLAELHAFIDRLTSHDWWYDFTDDHQVWKAGFNEWNAITTLANQQPLFNRILRTYALHRNNFGNPDHYQAYAQAVADAMVEIQGEEHVQQDEHSY